MNTIVDPAGLNPEPQVRRLAHQWDEARSALGAATMLRESAAQRIRAAVDLRIDGTVPLRGDDLRSALLEYEARREEWMAQLADLDVKERALLERLRRWCGLCEVCSAEGAEWVDGADARLCPRCWVKFDAFETEAIESATEQTQDDASLLRTL